MNTEFTGAKDKSNEEFNEWADKLEKMSDMEVSKEIFNRVIEKSDIDEPSKKIFAEAYNYSIKLINQGKPLEPNLLKIYLQDIKGHDINQIDLMTLFMMLSFCGIIFEK